MTSFEPAVLPASYVTASSEAVAAFAAAHYDLGGLPVCTLLNRGFNDAYALRTDTGEHFVLRLSGRRARGPADVAAETAFLAYPERNGALFTTALLPDGPHAAVLFRYAEGRRPDLDAPEDARAQGVTLARLHQVAAGFPDRDAGRYRLDLDHLLHRQVAAVLALDLDAQQARRNLSAFAARLADTVGRIDPELTRTRCHGDCHGLNARIATSGLHVGQTVFFDFDDGGYGYLAYDLAVHLWAQVSFGRCQYRLNPPQKRRLKVPRFIAF
jgi:Ser/Thr protein kinase RdoA (MazF antagonist)